MEGNGLWRINKTKPDLNEHPALFGFNFSLFFAFRF